MVCEIFGDFWGLSKLSILDNEKIPSFLMKYVKKKYGNNIKLIYW